MRRYLLFLMTLALLVTAAGAGCTAEPVSTVTHTDDPPTPLTPARSASQTRDLPPLSATPTPAPTEVAFPVGAEPLVTRAREDLAQKLDLPTDAIQLISVEAVDWPDAGLGCPQPDLMYAQVITSGFLVLLEVQDQTYQYHTDNDQRIVLCSDKGWLVYPVVPVSPIPIEPTPLEPDPLTGEVPQELLEAVIEDLLGRLDANREAIVVEKAEYVIWRDGSLGCPQPDTMYTMAPVPGYQIVLRVGQESYDYHTSDQGYLVLCEGGLAQKPLPPGEGGLVDQ